MPNFNIEANQGPKTFIMGPSGFVADVNSLGQLLTTGGGGGAFPQVVSGTVVSGGIPYFSSTTTEASSSLLALNAVVLGGGAGAAPFTSTGITTNGVGSLTVSQNLIAGLTFYMEWNGRSVMSSPADGTIRLENNAASGVFNVLQLGSDTGISRLGAASLAIGNGTAGDFSGTLSLAKLIVVGSSNPQISLSSTGSTDVSKLNVANDIGTAFFADIFGSTYAGGFANGILFGGASGSTPAPWMRFVSSAERATGGTTPIQFCAGGYGVTPQLAILASGALQIGGSDTSLSRVSAGVVGVGTGAQGSVAGTLSAAALLVNTARWSSGSLTPNTNVVGSVGDLYTWTGGTTSSTLWVKEVGSANATGWVAK